MTDMDKPKYQKLKDYIVETIQARQLKPGQKIFSENELAERFGACRHTVRHAIGDLVGEGWLYREQGKGTFVSHRQDERASRSRTVGVITTYLSDYIFPSIIRGIDAVLAVNGYNIMLGCTYNQHEKEKLCLENLINRDVAALIAEPTKSALPNPNLELYRELQEKGIPLLFIHGSYKDLGASWIVEDDIQAGLLATEHLTGLGHRSIGGIFKIDDIQGHYRYAGFQEAHKRAGLELSDSRVLWFDTAEMDEKLGTSGSAKMSRLLAECSAIVCYNDQVAIRVMDLARENGLSIPENLSLVSFDDSQLAIASEVKLTTVAHPKEKLGEEAGQAVLDMLSGRRKRVDIRMQPELIVRGSTRKYGK